MLAIRKKEISVKTFLDAFRVQFLTYCDENHKVKKSRDQDVFSSFIFHLGQVHLVNFLKLRPKFVFSFLVFSSTDLVPRTMVLPILT